MWSQVLTFEVAARELRAPASVIREASGADGKITYGEAFAAAIDFYRAKISDDAFERALRPTRPGPRPGQYGPPPERLRLRRDAARAAAPLVAEIDRRLARIAAIAHAQAPAQADDASRAASIARKIDGLAVALAKRNARALRGLGPKEVKA